MNDWKDNLIKICQILKDNGVDIKKIKTKGTLPDGKRFFLSLKDIEIEGIDIEKIITDNNLDENFQIGRNINKFRLAYNNVKGKLTDEERNIGEELEITKKRYGSEPIFKGRKISKFHVDFIRGILDTEIFTGHLNTVEVLKSLKEASILANEPVITDTGSIKRIVYMILEEIEDEEYKQQKIEEYNNIVKNNIGKRYPYKGGIGKPALGRYHQEEEAFKQRVINIYLPKILSGEITFDDIEKELHCSHTTVDKIIVEYYSGKEKELRAYQKAKNRNRGSIEASKNAKKMREEVRQLKVVTNNEFLLLSPQEQMEQLVAKIRTSKLKEEESTTSPTAILRDQQGKNNPTALSTEEATRFYINKIIEYFRGKNINGEINFSDEEIRYMIFRYPTLVSRSAETLDHKIEVITSYDAIDEKTVYGMAKTFPALLGYEAERTSAQLDLLESEGLIDYAISHPAGLMRSVDLLYALIQHAKKNISQDLSKIKRGSIFKVYRNITTKQLKEMYPYKNNEEDKEYCLNNSELENLQPSVSKSIEAGNVLSGVLKNKDIQERRDGN